MKLRMATCELTGNQLTLAMRTASAVASEAQIVPTCSPSLLPLNSQFAIHNSDDTRLRHTNATAMIAQVSSSATSASALLERSLSKYMVFPVLSF